MKKGYTNEQDFADAVAKEWDGAIRYVSNIGFHFNDRDVWERDIESLKTKRFFQEAVNNACLDLEKIASSQKDEDERKKTLKIRKKLKSRNFQVNCLDFIKSHPLLLTYPDDLDNYKHVVGLKSGIFDLNAKQFVDAPDTYLVTKRLNVNFNLDAACPLFDAMMVRLFPDEEVRIYG